MLPCCALGMMLIIQLAAFTRWFMRVILRKPQLEDEQEYWRPQKVSLKDKLAGKFYGKNRIKVAVIALIAEIALLGAISAFGGYDMVIMGFSHIGSLISDLFNRVIGG